MFSCPVPQLLLTDVLYLVVVEEEDEAVQKDSEVHS